VVADVTRRAEVERLRDEALRAFGRVDVWINNAGRGIHRRVMELSEADFDEMMAVNVKSALYGMQVAAAHFQARGAGQIVNVSSFLGRVPLVPVRSAYNAAKAALNALTANLRVELKATHPQIQVSLVMPGMVATDFAKNALGNPGAAAGGPPPGAANPQMRPQTAEEVAAVLAELVERPVPEVYTNPASAELARRYYADVAAFEAGAAGPRT
jgi:NAD(P)-dependent dehydrogenase (short-subunit alcohol dehydrogenase family)